MRPLVALSEDIHLRWFLSESALMKAILSFKPTIFKVEFGTKIELLSDPFPCSSSIRCDTRYVI